MDYSSKCETTMFYINIQTEGTAPSSPSFSLEDLKEVREGKNPGNVVG